MVEAFKDGDKIGSCAAKAALQGDVFLDGDAEAGRRFSVGGGDDRGFGNDRQFLDFGDDFKDGILINQCLFFGLGKL